MLEEIRERHRRRLVSGAFRITFRREPDHEELVHWLKYMRDSSLEHMLDEMRQKQASAKHAAAQGAADHGSTAVGPDVAGVSDEAFVASVYRHILSREPDAEGNAHYLGMLRAGVAREVVFQSINGSPESQSKNGKEGAASLAFSTPTAIVLDEKRSVSPSEWQEYLARLFRAKSGAPPQRSVRVDNPTLWICVCPSHSQLDRTCCPATEATINKLQALSAYQIRVISAGPKMSIPSSEIETTADLLALVDPADLILFIQSGDELHPDLMSMLEAYDAFSRKLILMDFYFRDGQRIHPVLLHGVDAIHARACDYFQSRFFVRGDAAAVFSTKSLSIREIALEVLNQCENAGGAGVLHVPVPLLCAGNLNTAFIRDQVRDLLCTSPGIGQVDADSCNSAAPVTAVICTKDNAHLLRPLVRQLLLIADISDVVIVSNNTSDLYALMLLQELTGIERCTVLRYDKPFNFSAQCNLGAKYARGRYLLFLNDDISPISAGWLNTLLMHAVEDPQRIIGPLLLYPDQSVQHAGMYLGFNGCAGHAFRGVRIPAGAPMFELVAPRQVSCLTGAVLLMERRLYETLNGFDPMLATTLQDVDFSLRALCTGATLIFEPRAIMFHMESIAVKTTLADTATQRRREAEYAYFASRWQSELKRDRWLNPRLDVQDEKWMTLQL